MQLTLTPETSDYIGWVPCLNGQLVFDLVECGLKKKNHGSIEIIYRAKDSSGSIIEYILVHSTVDWKDFGGNEVDGLWSVVLISKRSLKSNYHEGVVCFMPKSMQENTSWNGALEILININSTITTSDQPDVINLILDFESKINVACSTSDCCYRSGFKLDEDGIVWLKYFDKEGADNENDGLIITRQSYYYIKYTWHRHQHHDSRAETLTTTHKLETNWSKNDVAERLITDLKRNLVRFKRGIDHTSHREVLKAKGIISYTKALIETMKAKEFIEDKYYSKELNFLDYFQESIDIIAAGIEKDISMHNQAVGDARAVILFIFAIIITPSLVINKNPAYAEVASSKTPAYVDFIRNLYSDGTNFAFFISIVGLFLFVYISLQTRYGNFWILWECFKKPVAYVVKDRQPNDFLSNTNVLSALIIFIGITLIISSIIHWFLVKY